MKVKEAVKSLTQVLDMTVKDPSVDKDSKANLIIHSAALLCAIVAVQPLPFADIFVLTPIQLVMVTYLNKVKENPYKQSDLKEIVSSLLGVVGWGTLAQHTILGLYKTVIPFMGAVTTIPLVYGATFALGKCAEALIDGKAKGQNISKENLKRMAEEIKQKSKEENKDLSLDGLLEQFKKLQKDSQEYAAYIAEVEKYDVWAEGRQDIVDIGERFRKQKERLNKRITSKYHTIQISEDALYAMSAFPKAVILGEIEDIIAQIDRDITKISGIEEKYADNRGVYIIRRPFGAMEVAKCEKGYYIRSIDPSRTYERDDIWKFRGAVQEETLYDQEIRERFHRLMSAAQHEILIISPWANHYVVNTILPILKAAVRRGVRIKIIYGIENSNSSGSERGNRSDEVMLGLQASLGSALSVRKDNTHVKLCICDDTYLIGSYNFLSFSGVYKTDVRHEQCSCGNNSKRVQELKQKYFSGF